MFYEYRQNNSGGVFDYNLDQGISVHVIVEADSNFEADDLAERAGLYFDGDRDCSCCGNRWYPADHEGSEVPSDYGNPIDLDGKYSDAGKYGSKWLHGYEGFVHYKDGTVRGFWAE